MRSREVARSDSVVAVVFLAVMLAGLLGVIDVLVRRVPDHGVDSSTSLVSLANGHVTADLESTLESGMRRSVALRVIAAMRYLLFHSGNPGVVVGRDGWLYTREEFERYPTDARTLQERLSFIEAVRDSLAQRGVRLLVALVPSKARVIRGPLPERWRDLAEHPRYEDALGRLASLSIPTVDLRTALGSPAESFLKTDTHWNPEGANRAARAIAAAAAENQLTAGIPRSLFVTTAQQSIEVYGDLLSFIPVGPWAPALGIGPEPVVTNRTVPAEASSLGLFDTPQIPVTLVGTSYSADERWNFLGALKQELDMDVLNISTEAVGPFVPMAEYLGGTAFAEVRPAFVVWEIPERYLTLPDVETPDLESDGASPVGNPLE